MCNFKNTIYTCGCTVEENTSLCGYIHDDISECMNNTSSVDVKVPTTCGKKECRSRASPRRNVQVTVPETPRRGSNDEVKRVHFSPTVVNINDRHNDYYDESSDESVDQPE